MSRGVHPNDAAGRDGVRDRCRPLVGVLAELREDQLARHAQLERAPARVSASATGMRRETAHTSQDFETELRELRAHLGAMAARCERVVALAVDAFRAEDRLLLASVQSLDAQIDADALTIHALTLRILALRQPVAGDLRFLATALKLIVDLGRIGDEAVNIGERIGEGTSVARHLVADALTTMTDDVRGMVRIALEALVAWDEEGAREVLHCDDAVDQRCAVIIARMTELMSRGPCGVAAGLSVIRVTKSLERIADHATNVAEEVIFMVRADDVRHQQWSRPPAAGSASAPAVAH